ncbi:MAG: hypothetical protein PVG39_07895 [Desulfobacteraceae bacterium]
MRHIVAEAKSWTEIQLWRKASKKCKLPIWMEIFEDVAGKDIKMARITVYDPYLHNDWQKLKNKLERKLRREISFKELHFYRIQELKDAYKKLFDVTPKGKRLVAKKKAEEEEKEREKHPSVEKWLRSTSGRGMARTYTKRLLEEANQNCLISRIAT